MLYLGQKRGSHCARCSLQRLWNLELRIIAWLKSYIFTKALERWYLGLFWKFGTSKEYTQWFKKNTNLSWQNCDIVRSSKFWLYANRCGDTADSAWVFNDASYRIPYHGWLVALRGKLSHVARRGMIAFCQRKGVLKNVNMLTISKSSRSYIPGKPLSSDLRHIIIDKIIDGEGNPLTMIFPGRFVNLVRVKHVSMLGRDPLLLSQPCFLLDLYGWRSEFKDSYSDAPSSFV